MESCQNTDKEIWREVPDNFYSPSMHVTKEGGIGMNVGGHVIVMPIESWHALGKKAIKPKSRWRHDLACWLVRWYSKARYGQ